MDVHEAKKIIDENFECAENSFMFLLHERDEFSDEGCKALIKAVVALAKTGEKDKTPELSRKIVYVHTKFLHELLWNYYSHSTLSGVPDDLAQYVEAFQYAVDGYFQGYALEFDTLFG